MSHDLWTITKKTTISCVHKSCDTSVDCFVEFATILNHLPPSPPSSWLSSPMYSPLSSPLSSGLFSLTTLIVEILIQQPRLYHIWSQYLRFIISSCLNMFFWFECSHWPNFSFSIIQSQWTIIMDVWKFWFKVGEETKTEKKKKKREGKLNKTNLRFTDEVG